MEKEQRIRNVVGARRKYSKLSQDICKNGSIEEKNIRKLIEDNKKEMLEIERELKQCRQQYNYTIKSIGKAHKEAKLHDDQELFNDELIKKREEKVRSRAEMVLLEEIHRLRLAELQGQLKKEKLLKQRRDLFRMKSPSPKVRASGEGRAKLKEWKKIEDLIRQELDQLKTEKTVKLTRQPTDDDGATQAGANELSAKTLPAKRVIKAQVNRRNVQVQTESSTGEPLREITQATFALENVIACRIREKLDRVHRQQQNVQQPKVTKVYHDMAVNTSLKQDSSSTTSPDQLSVTSYLDLPPNQPKNVCRCSNSSIDKVGSSSTQDKTSTIISSASEINLKELIHKIQSIRTLVNKQKSGLPEDLVSIESIDGKLLTKGHGIIHHLQNDKKNQDSTLSDLSLSSSTFSGETIKRLHPVDTNSDLSMSLSSLSDESSYLENGRWQDDTSISSVSQTRSLCQTSFEFSNFSRLLNVDKERFWTEVLDLAGIKNGFTNAGKQFKRQSPMRISPSRNIFQSTPKACRTLAI